MYRCITVTQKQIVVNQHYIPLVNLYYPDRPVSLKMCLAEKIGKTS
nr:MAG TPA: hypothetical protein [Caudoviricetes sp.]